MIHLLPLLLCSLQEPRVTTLAQSIEEANALNLQATALLARLGADVVVTPAAAAARACSAAPTSSRLDMLLSHEQAERVAKIRTLSPQWRECVAMASLREPVSGVFSKLLDAIHERPDGVLFCPVVVDSECSGAEGIWPTLDRDIKVLNIGFAMDDIDTGGHDMFGLDSGEQALYIAPYLDMRRATRITSLPIDGTWVGKNAPDVLISLGWFNDITLKSKKDARQQRGVLTSARKLHYASPELAAAARYRTDPLAPLLYNAWTPTTPSAPVSIFSATDARPHTATRRDAKRTLLRSATGSSSKPEPWPFIVAFNQEPWGEGTTYPFDVILDTKRGSLRDRPQLGAAHGGEPGRYSYMGGHTIHATEFALKLSHRASCAPMDLSRRMSAQDAAKELAYKKGNFALLLSGDCANPVTTAPTRIALLDAISSAYRPVTSGGTCRHTPSFKWTEFESPIGEDTAKFAWSIGEKAHRKFKFAMAWDNYDSEGHLSEKLATAYLSKSVPIYWGAPDVLKYINPNAVIVCNVTATSPLRMELSPLRKGESHWTQAWDEMDGTTPFLGRAQFEKNPSFVELVAALRCDVDCDPGFKQCIERIREVDENDELWMGMLREPLVVNFEESIADPLQIGRAIARVARASRGPVVIDEEERKRVQQLIVSDQYDEEAGRLPLPEEDPSYVPESKWYKSCCQARFLLQGSVSDDLMLRPP